MRNPSARVSDPNTFFSSEGESVKPVYAPSLMKDGTIKLEKSGSIDIQKEIDSYRDQTDMAYILQRLNFGDNSVLAAANGSYGDFTNVPRTMAEAMQMAIDGEKAFEKLPKDVRSVFDFNFRKWLMEAGTDSWYDAMKPILEPVPTVSPDVSGEVGDGT